MGTEKKANHGHTCSPKSGGTASGSFLRHPDNPVPNKQSFSAKSVMHWFSEGAMQCSQNNFKM